MLLLLSLFLLTLLISAALTYVADWGGRRFGVIDLPDSERKFHPQATPRTGGLAIIATFSAVFLATPWIAELFGESFSIGQSSLFFVLSGVLLCLVGAWDDRHGMKARTKLFWQVVAIAPFALWGRTSAPVSLLGVVFEQQFVSTALVFFWLVSCCNFINLLDGMDGLAGTLGLVVCLTAGFLGGWQSQPETVFAAVVLAGGLVGFLVHNWPPARIFMGDCGSLPLGFLVGALSLQASAKKAFGVTLVVPAVLLTVPLIDTGMAILRRKLTGRKIGHGDRGHIHHLLRDRGLSPRQTLLVVGSLSALSACGAVVATLVDNDLIAVVVGLVLLCSLVGGRVFGFQETMLLARHFTALWSLLTAFPRSVRARMIALQLESGTARGELRLWEKIVRRARRMDITRVHFQFAPMGGERAPIELDWQGTTSSLPGWFQWSSTGELDRPNQGRATYQLSGFSRDGRMPSASAELTELLITLCRCWSDSGTAVIVPIVEAERQPIPNGMGPELIPILQLPGASRATTKEDEVTTRPETIRPNPLRDAA